MSPDEFVSKGRTVELTDQAAAQSHFNNLCTVLDELTPTDVDPKGEWYAFECDEDDRRRWLGRRVEARLLRLRI